MSSGARIGLQTGQQVSADIRAKQEEERRRLARLDPSMSGRDSQTIYRDKFGRKVDVDALNREKEEQARELEALGQRLLALEREIRA